MQKFLSSLVLTAVILASGCTQPLKKSTATEARAPESLAESSGSSTLVLAEIQGSYVVHPDTCRDPVASRFLIGSEQYTDPSGRIGSNDGKVALVQKWGPIRAADRSEEVLPSAYLVYSVQSENSFAITAFIETYPEVISAIAAEQRTYIPHLNDQKMTRRPLLVRRLHFETMPSIEVIEERLHDADSVALLYPC